MIHDGYTNYLYNKITIKDRDNIVKKEISFNGENNFNEVITSSNLQNGINYENCYSIEIGSAEPSRTKIYYLGLDWQLQNNIINNLKPNTEGFRFKFKIIIDNKNLFFVNCLLPFITQFNNKDEAKKVIKTKKYEAFLSVNSGLYFKKESGEIKKHNLFGNLGSKVNKIEKNLNDEFYILLDNYQIWKSNYITTNSDIGNNIETGNPIEITNNNDDTNDNKVKDFIIDKFNNIFVLTEKNNVYYQKHNDNKFNKINIFTKNEQINNILYNKEIGITFLTDKSPILINNNQINDLLKGNTNYEIQYPLIREKNYL